MVCIDPKVNKRTDFKVSKHANDEGLCILVVISEDGSNPTTPLFHLDTREWLAKTHGCISQFLMFSSQWFTLFAMSVHLLKRIKHGMLIYIYHRSWPTQNTIGHAIVYVSDIQWHTYPLKLLLHTNVPLEPQFSDLSWYHWYPNISDWKSVSWSNQGPLVVILPSLPLIIYILWCPWSR